MKDLIQIRLHNIKNVGEDVNEAILDVMSNIINKAKEHGVWCDHISSIVVTDDLVSEVEKQSKKWQIKVDITQAKEYRVISKTLYNHKSEAPEYILYIHLLCFLMDSVSVDEITLNQAARIYAKKWIPPEILQLQDHNAPEDLKSYINLAAISWCTTNFGVNKTYSILGGRTEPMPNNQFLVAFKRSLKRNLFEYNKDDYDNTIRISRFWNKYIDSLNTLFLRFIENDADDIKYQIPQKEGCRELIYDVVNEIDNTTSLMVQNNTFETSRIKEKIIKFSEYFEVQITDLNTKGFHINLTKNPKDYFDGEIVDTEPRIICFVDILGFKKLVQEYEEDITSTILQDIQESFEQAEKYLFQFSWGKNQDLIKHLEHQTFSDNICISIPYFDNQSDFIANFLMIATYVRGFQYLMMTKGFFTRGGLSTGSYYADNNIIFSEGLIQAYNLEKDTAIYPRTIVDPMVFEKLNSNSMIKDESFGFNKTIIVDENGTAFLNPFGLIETSIKQFKSILNKLDEDDDDKLIGAINLLAKSVGDIAISLFEGYAPFEKDSLNTIQNYINNNLEKFNDNQDIRVKYEWINEFVGWIKGEKTTQFSFRYLEDAI